MNINNIQNEKVNIVLIGYYQLFRKGIELILQREKFINVIKNGNDFSILNEIPEQSPIDIILLDTNNFLIQLRDIEKIIAQSDTKIILLSSVIEEKYVKQAISAGVHGYILIENDIPFLMEAIKLVSKNKYYFHPIITNLLLKEYHKKQEQISSSDLLDSLTKRQKDVLILLAKGHNNNQVGHILGITEITVKSHISNILKILGVKDRTQAVIKAIQSNWV